jgi:hypothetical protein
LNFALATAIGRTLQPGDEVLITQLDHEGNRGPWLALEQRGVIVREVCLLPSGELDPADMAAKVTPRTRLLAIGASANSLGTVNDLGLARRLTSHVGALLVVDAVHYAPHFPIDVQALGVDFLLCSGYKFYPRPPAHRSLERAGSGRPVSDRNRHLEPCGDRRFARGGRIHRRLGQRRLAAGAHRRCHDEHCRLRT